jgi:glyoxylase-like metal-dependent hydrolase (beta-lactamase superfamily II)
LVRALAALLFCAAVHGQTLVLDTGVEWLPGRFTLGVQPDGNSVLIEAPDGWIVVDSGRHPAHAQALIERMRASGKPLRVIVNTQWHLDHSGGNHALRAAYPQAQVIASDAVDDAVGTTPDVRVGERITLDLAGRGIGLGVERHAVSAGDLWLYDATAQVLVAGDLVMLPAPLFDTACPERWTQALDQLATLRFRWLVPGHGAPLGRGQFVIYREAYGRLLRCAASAAPKLQCIDGWLRDAGGLFPQDQQPLARSLLSKDFDERLRAPRAAQCRL